MRRLLTGATLFAAFLISGCSSLALLSETLVTDSIAIADSVVFTPTNIATAKISCQYPVDGNPMLVDSINTWIAACFNRAAGGSIPAIVNNALYEQLESDSTEMALIMSDPELAYDYFGYAYDCNIRVVYDDDDYITFCRSLYVYMGGAHGSTLTDYTTFCKSGQNAGRRMGWDLLAESNPADLRKIITGGLMDYLNVDRLDELREHLLIGENEQIPFPETPPFLMKEGIKVIYQEYEIGPYAIGAPEIVVGQIKRNE